MQIEDVLGDFDFSRSDKRYSLKVPSYRVEDTTVFYQFNLKDLVNNRTYVSQFRYNTLKEWHQKLYQLNYQLPPFPVTHFWTKTNKNPVLIQKRKQGLQAYFSRVINDPYIRGYREVKTIISLCKHKSDNRRRLSEDHKTIQSRTTRCQSQTKSKTKTNVSRDQWKRMSREPEKRPVVIV